MTDLLVSIRETVRVVAVLERSLPETPTGNQIYDINLQMLKANLAVARKQIGALGIKLEGKATK